MKLVAKLFITGKIEAVTGLHIGGSKTALDIGGVDLNVIKTHDGVPFIPGSSLKGKLRSLLARAEGSVAVNKRQLKKGDQGKTDEDVPYLVQLFGNSGDSEEESAEITRLLVRDALLDTSTAPSQKEFPEMDFTYSDVKFENTIDRKKGVAQHPRQLERVPAGANFNFELVYDIYEEDEQQQYTPDKDELKGQNRTCRDQHLWAISTAMQLLQDDYLGGQGSRGYGKIVFKDVAVSQKRFKQFRYQPAELDEELQAFAEELKNLV